MAATALMIPQQQQPQQAPLPKGPQNDNIQDIIRRKREMDASKRRQHLTEADCNILLTNANEFSFADGQIIGHEGDILNAAYRVKAGAVSLMRNGRKLCEVTQGWFIGETVFLSAKFAELSVDLVANGPVILAEINVPFVQKLFEVDKTLALKFYRHIATKLSVIYLNFIHPPQSITHRAMSVSSLDSISSSSSSSTDSLPSPLPMRSPSMDSGISELNTPRRKLTKRQSFHFSRAPFKAYPLASSRAVTKTVLVKAKKLVITTESLGLKFSKKVPFTQISNFVRTSEDSVTVVADNNRAKTLFFKNTSELEEFYGVLQSLVERVAQPSSKSLLTAPISSPKPFIAEEEDIMHTTDKEMLTRIGVRRQYKKGDVVVEEGDLFQRVYMINSGSMSALLGGQEVNTLKGGDSFGVITMFHLRPFPTTVVVTSETAEVVIVPAFKIMELIAHDNDLAVRIYRKAAIVVSLQIEKLIQVNKEKGILL